MQDDIRRLEEQIQQMTRVICILALGLILNTTANVIAVKRMQDQKAEFNQVQLEFDKKMMDAIHSLRQSILE